MTEEMNNDLLKIRYFVSVWAVEDILARFPAATPDLAQKFLDEYQQWIREAMVRAGWNAIDLLGGWKMGWKTSAEQEADAYGRARKTLAEWCAR